MTVILVLLKNAYHRRDTLKFAVSIPVTEVNAGNAVPVNTAYNVSLPRPPTIVSNTDNVSAVVEALNVSSFAVPVNAAPVSIPVVSDQVNRKSNSLKIK